MSADSARAASVAQLSARTFDLLIIGGGIVGAGIARDAALRGLSVALVEQHDFASGTSSKTSKLIHGGLRYLEQGHVGLVRDSVRERALLLRHARGCVWPLSLLLPNYTHDPRPPWQVRTGLWLYDHLAATSGVARHRWLTASEACAAVPGLQRQHLRGAGQYTDGQMDDARLCIATILDARDHGAVCCNYARVRDLLRQQGRVCGAMIEDRWGTGMIEVRARVVINATGPWADGLRQRSQPTAAARIAPTKGIHVFVPRLAEVGLFVRAPQDQRMVFVLPWQGHTLIGTTESNMEGSLDALQATRAEVEYLLTVVRQVLPARTLTGDDVIATCAGARPLLTFHGSVTRASRESCIEEDAAGLVSVMGGKYTTFRQMAQQTVDMAQHRHRLPGGASRTRDLPLHAPAATFAELAREANRVVDPAQITRAVAQYGARAQDILQHWLRAPALRAPLCPHHPQTLAEIVMTFEQEQARTLIDVLARRMPVAWSACHGLDGLEAMAHVVPAHTRLTAAAWRQHVTDYRTFIARSRACCAGA